MANTNIRSRQIKDGDVLRADVNTSTSGSALITKVIAGTGISLSSTGADAGTGDVTVTVNASLDNLSDVVITSPASAEVLTYNGTNWVNSAATGGTSSESVGSKLFLFNYY